MGLYSVRDNYLRLGEKAFSSEQKWMAVQVQHKQLHEEEMEGVSEGEGEREIERERGMKRDRERWREGGSDPLR